MNWILLSPPPLSADPDTPPKFGTCSRIHHKMYVSMVVMLTMQFAYLITVQEQYQPRRFKTALNQSHWYVMAEFQTFNGCYCCRKATVCNGHQWLDFSVPELVRSQSTCSTYPEVLQKCASFTLCS